MSAVSKHGDGDEGIAQMLAPEADRINAAERQPDWSGLAALAAEARQGGDVAALMVRARALVPADRPEVLADFESRLRK